MSKKILAIVSAAMLVGPAAAKADLITAGNFDTATLNGASNYLISANLNKWLMLNFSLSPYGPSGEFSDKFAQNSTAGTGTDNRLVQFIDASSLGSGQTLDLLFDYVYAEAAGFDPQARVSLIGIAADRSYSLFGGGGVDGIPYNNGDFAVASPDALLGQRMLPYISSWSMNNLLSVTLSGTYSYIGVVFSSGCYGASTCGTLRGIDNVRLSTVPEPGTLGLLGLGLVGLGLSRRRKAN